MSGESCRRHLSAGHAIDAVIYKYYCYIFTAICGVNYLGCAYSGEIAVALISEYNILGPHSLYARGDRRGPAVGGLANIEVPIVVRYNCAAYRCDRYNLFTDAKFVYRLASKPVYQPVSAPCAVMILRIAQAYRSGKYWRAFYPFCFFCLFLHANASTRSRISSSPGTPPPMRP